MTGRTNDYRVRRGLFGKCILQYQSCILRSDHNGGGWVHVWADEKYETAPKNLIDPN